jgi:twitching motility protein PilT
VEIKELLKSALLANVSDVILVVNEPPIFRVNNALILQQSPALTAKTIDSIILAMISTEKKAIFDKERELDFAYDLDGKTRFRVNLHFEKGNPAITLRMIPNRIPSLKELGLPAVIGELSRIPRGLILVTGPTGHGKSTTQACMVDMINNDFERHIITIEDPIEYLHGNKKSIIEQREVGSDTLSFAQGLKHVLRQNPDVILIGEMRDFETIGVALTAAETGHLVISTLHTSDATTSIDRIIDVFPPHQQNQVRTQLSFTLQGVISQQLMVRKDGKGRIPAVEILKVNSGIRNIIRKGSTHEISSMMEINKRSGMQTMDGNLAELYRQGLITREDAISRAINQEHFEKTILL